MLHRDEAYYAANRTADDRKEVNGCQIILSFSASPINGVIEKIQPILSNAYDERTQVIKKE